MAKAKTAKRDDRKVSPTVGKTGKSRGKSAETASPTKKQPRKQAAGSVTPAAATGTIAGFERVSDDSLAAGHAHVALTAQNKNLRNSLITVRRKRAVAEKRVEELEAQLSAANGQIEALEAQLTALRTSEQKPETGTSELSVAEQAALPDDTDALADNIAEGIPAGEE